MPGTVGCQNTKNKTQFLLLRSTESNKIVPTLQNVAVFILVLLLLFFILSDYYIIPSPKDMYNTIHGNTYYAKGKIMFSNISKIFFTKVEKCCQFSP